LVAGGLPALEVTLRTPAALDAIREMASVEGGVVGAGTLLTEKDVEAAKSADGITVLFNRAGGKETIAGAKDALALRAVPAIRAIIKKGRVVRRESGSAACTDTSRDSIGGRLAAVREARGFKQAAMAHDLGLSPQR